MYWFELLISASLFAFLLTTAINKYIAPDLVNADYKAISFMEKMRAKYCLYKLLDENNFNLDNVLSYLENINFYYKCDQSDYYIYYQILTVPTGKSIACTNCIYFNITNNGNLLVCVNNITATLEGDFVKADKGTIVDNIWTVNATNSNACAETSDNYITILEVNPTIASVWGYPIENGTITNPIYSETVWLKAKNNLWVKVKFTLS